MSHFAAQHQPKILCFKYLNKYNVFHTNFMSPKQFEGVHTIQTQTEMLNFLEGSNLKLIGDKWSNLYILVTNLSGLCE